MTAPGDILAVLAKLLPILAMIGVGMVLRRTQFMPETAMEGMKKLAVNITLPIVIFLSLLEAELQPAYLPLALFVFFVSTLLLGAGRLIVKRLGWENRYAGLLFTGYENGMLGYGVFAAAFGAELIYPIVILDLGQTLFFALIFTTYMRVLNQEINGLSWKSAGKACLTNPYLLVSVLAILLNGTGLTEGLRENLFSGALLECLDMLAGLTTPLMCLAIGYGMRVRRKYLGRAGVVIALRLALLTVVAVIFDQLIVCRILGLDGLFRAAVYTMFLLPPFFVGALLIRREETESREFALSVISLHIIVFMVLFCLIVPVLRAA